MKSSFVQSFVHPLVNPRIGQDEGRNKPVLLQRRPGAPEPLQGLHQSLALTQAKPLVFELLPYELEGSVPFWGKKKVNL